MSICFLVDSVCDALNNYTSICPTFMKDTLYVSETFIILAMIIVIILLTSTLIVYAAILLSAFASFWNMLTVDRLLVTSKYHRVFFSE